MAKIISLRGDQHSQVFGLLPWYATGQLDRADRDAVEAHLGACPECQAELAFQRRLAQELPILPVGVEDGWRRMRGQVLALESARPASPWRRLGRGWRTGVPWLGWAMACLLLAAGGGMLLPRPAPGPYHALGAAAADPSGDVMVMFRPQTPEGDFRRILTAAQARLVGGPTAAGAYVLDVPPAGRAAALAALRARPEVLSAEPIDSGARP